MTTQEIAAKLVEYNEKMDHESAYRELFHESAVSIENWGGEAMRYEGMDAIKQKGEAWMQSVAEFHNVTVGTPIYSDGSIAMTFGMDITYKDERGRQNMTELAIYTVTDGKISAEEFRA